MPIAKVAASTPRHVVFKGPQCTVGALLDTLDDKDEAALLAIMERNPNDLATNRWIADFLVADGHPRIQAATINRHRRDHLNGSCRR